jgi:hypothetical protein
VQSRMKLKQPWPPSPPPLPCQPLAVPKQQATHPSTLPTPAMPSQFHIQLWPQALLHQPTCTLQRKSWRYAPSSSRERRQKGARAMRLRVACFPSRWYLRISLPG